MPVEAERPTATASISSKNTTQGEEARALRNTWWEGGGMVHRERRFGGETHQEGPARHRAAGGNNNSSVRIHMLHRAS